jgi:MFS superfamily sulfate permease-like transporter
MLVFLILSYSIILPFLGKICEHVEEPVVAGFLNAFAVFLVKSQVGSMRLLEYRKCNDS